MVRNAIDLKAAIWRDEARRIRSLDRQTRESCIMFERMAMRRPNPLAPNRERPWTEVAPRPSSHTIGNVTVASSNNLLC